MNTDCSTLNGEMIRQIADVKFGNVAKYIAPMMNVAVNEFADAIEPIINQAVLLDPQHEEEINKAVSYIMANSIKAAFGEAFNKILQEDDDNA